MNRKPEAKVSKFGGYSYSKAKEALNFSWPEDKDWPTELPMLGKLDQFENVIVFFDALGNELEGVQQVPPSWDAVGQWYNNAIQSSPEMETKLKDAFVVVANPKC